MREYFAASGIAGMTFLWFVNFAAVLILDIFLWDWLSALIIAGFWGVLAVINIVRWKRKAAADVI